MKFTDYFVKFLSCATLTLIQFRILWSLQWESLGLFTVSLDFCFQPQTPFDLPFLGGRGEQNSNKNTLTFGVLLDQEHGWNSPLRFLVRLAHFRLVIYTLENVSLKLFLYNTSIPPLKHHCQYLRKLHCIFIASFVIKAQTGAMSQSSIVQVGMQLLCSRSIFTLCTTALCICMCTHTYISIYRKVYTIIYIFLCFFLRCLSYKNHKLTKPPVLGLGTLASGWWSQRFPKPYRLLQVLRGSQEQ